jgi:hypothetical protein
MSEDNEKKILQELKLNNKFLYEILEELKNKKVK